MPSSSACGRKGHVFGHDKDVVFHGFSVAAAQQLHVQQCLIWRYCGAGSVWGSAPSVVKPLMRCSAMGLPCSCAAMSLALAAYFMAAGGVVETAQGLFNAFGIGFGHFGVPFFGIGLDFVAD